MGDGGGCHPRDNIALSWLARKLDISNDFFDQIMQQREKQTDWLANLIIENQLKDKKTYILGKSFKPETNITTGSPSILLNNILREKGVNAISYDPYVDTKKPVFDKGVYFIGTQHEIFEQFEFPNGSIVIDPFRMINKKKGLKVIRIGDSKED